MAGRSPGQHGVDHHVGPRTPPRPQHRTVDRVVLDERLLDPGAALPVRPVDQDDRGVGHRGAVVELDLAGEPVARGVGELLVLGRRLLDEPDTRRPLPRQGDGMVLVPVEDPAGRRLGHRAIQWGLRALVRRPERVVVRGGHCRERLHGPVGRPRRVVALGEASVVVPVSDGQDTVAVRDRPVGPPAQMAGPVAAGLVPRHALDVGQGIGPPQAGLGEPVGHAPAVRDAGAVGAKPVAELGAEHPGSFQVPARRFSVAEPGGVEYQSVGVEGER